MTEFISTNVKIDTIEGDVLKWAFGGAYDFWTSEEEARIREGKVYDEIYKEEGKEYHIVDSQKVIDDIIYRLDEMLPEMEEAPQSEIRACKRVVKKLENINQ